jgi:hypothetical protein
MRILKPAVFYFGLVFATGIVLGTLRVVLIVPRLGERAAELLEMPVMLIAVVFAAHWTNQRYPEPAGSGSRLSIGLTALGFMLGAEVTVGLGLRGLSPLESLTDHDPISGAAYHVSLLLFAAMPWLLSRR